MFPELSLEMSKRKEWKTLSLSAVFDIFFIFDI